MKKLLTLISITTIVAATACSNPGAGDNGVLSATEEAQISTSAESVSKHIPNATEEPVDKLNILNVEGHDVWVRMQSDKIDIFKIDVYLGLVERAIKLLVDLDRDFGNTLVQIKNPDNLEWLNNMFNNSERNLASIGAAYIAEGERIELSVRFSEIDDRAFFISVKFEDEDGEWVIDNVYDTSMGQ